MRLVYEPLTEIPVGFTEVEYLESTGTQYIDTGYVPSNTTGQYARMQYTTVNNGVTFGSMVSGNRVVGPYYAQTSSKWYCGWGSNEPSINATTPTTSIMYDLYLNFNNNRVAKVNDIVLANSLGEISGSYPSITLFRRNYSAGYAYLSGKVYKYQITEGNKLVRDFVPCLDNNNVPCMYDKVEGKAYYNAGTGTFSYGRKIIPVEYLESSGTQYIDTGVKGKNNIDFDYRCVFTNLDGTAQCVGGNWSGSASSSVSLYLGLIRANGNFAYHYDGTGSPVVVMNTTVQDTPYSVQGHMWVGEQYMVINGTKSSVGTITNTFTSSLNMYLFGINNNVLSNPAYMKLYYCKIWDNGILVRDFIPCKDENGVGFMFDKVTHSAYLNAGTGSFTFGKTLPKKKLRLIKDSKRRLPKGFTEVEYLQSSGSQYIDTGVIGNGEFDVDYTYYQTQDTANAIFAGTRSSSQHLNFGQRSNGSSGGFSMAYLGEYWQAIASPAINTKIRVQISYKSGSQTGYLDGVAMTGKTLVGTEETNLSIYIFKRHHYGTDNVSGLVGRLYYFKLWKDGALVRDMIPCLDASNVPCMWDSVERKAYYNVGTGNFNYGNQIIPVEYLESSRTQYVNTGISFPNGFRVKGEISFNQVSPSCAVFGSWGSSSPYYRNFFGISQLGFYTGFGGSSYQYFGIATTNKKYSFNVRNVTGSEYLEVDGVVYPLEMEGEAGTYTSTSAYIFAFHKGSGVGEHGAEKLYWLKAYNENDVLVGDYIPCKDENGVGYLFDLVTHSLYANTGTGSFAIGDEIKDITRFLEGE